MLLSLTTLFLVTGLAPRSLAGLEALEFLSSGFSLVDLKCLPLSETDDVDAFNWLIRLRVRGGEGGRSAC